MRRDLTGEALFLARLVAEMLPQEPEALGLLALMLHAEARRAARRRNERGEYVPLASQDSSLWDAQMIREAEALLVRASELGAIGRYQLEAAVQSAHVARCRSGRANWAAVLEIYDALFAVTGSPVVAINRALAVAEVRGAQAGLAALPDPETDGRLAEYQPYWAARAELLGRAGAVVDAQPCVRCGDWAGARSCDSEFSRREARDGAVIGATRVASASGVMAELLAGDRGLAEGDAAVVGGDFAMGEYFEAFAAQRFRGSQRAGARSGSIRRSGRRG